MAKRFQYIIVLICITTVISIIQSCDKHRAKKLAGIYDCEVNYYYWDMTPKIIDTSYNERLEIKQNGKFLTVLAYTIHIDSLWEGKEYYNGDVHNYIKVQFKKDSLYLTKNSGGLGGNSSFIYKGKKLTK